MSVRYRTHTYFRKALLQTAHFFEVLTTFTLGTFQLTICWAYATRRMCLRHSILFTEDLSLLSLVDTSHVENPCTH